MSSPVDSKKRKAEDAEQPDSKKAKTEEKTELMYLHVLTDLSDPYGLLIEVEKLPETLDEILIRIDAEEFTIPSKKEDEEDIQLVDFLHDIARERCPGYGSYRCTANETIVYTGTLTTQ